MNVLLTGASGSLGTYLKEAWTKNPSFFFTGRKDLDCPNYLKGNILDAVFLEQVLDRHQISTVIHNAAHTQIWGPWRDFENSNIAMMAQLIRTLSERKGIRLIFLSTPSIYHFSDHVFVSEAYIPQRFPNHYAQSKYIAEQLLRQSGIEYTIIRPRAVLGRTDRTLLPRLMKQYHSGRLRIIGKGKNLADFTAMRNVQHALELTLKAPNEAWNQVYNLSNGDPVSVFDLINTLLTGLGLEPVKKHIPVLAARTVAGLSEFVSMLRNTEPAISRYQLELLYLNYTLSIEKAKQLLSYTPLQSNIEMIEELIKAYKSDTL